MNKKVIKGVLFALLFVISGVCFSCGEKVKISLEDGISEGKEVASGSQERSSESDEQGEAADTVSAAEPAEGDASVEAAPEEEAGEIQVHVCGAVVNPGVYTMPAGSRLYQAVDYAGGMTAEAASDYLNLAGTVADGEKVQVPTKEEVAQGLFTAENGTDGAVSSSNGTNSDITGDDKTGSDTSEGGSSKLVNINTADAAALMTLPGIGSAKADSIITYRTEHNGFKKKEDIMEITGIKQAVYEKIKDFICVQ